MVGWLVLLCVLHGESITDQASPRIPTQRTFQPQEAVQPLVGMVYVAAVHGWLVGAVVCAIVCVTRRKVHI